MAHKGVGGARWIDGNREVGVAAGVGAMQSWAQIEFRGGREQQCLARRRAGWRAHEGGAMRSRRGDVGVAVGRYCGGEGGAPRGRRLP